LNYQRGKKKASNRKEVIAIRKGQLHWGSNIELFRFKKKNLRILHMASNRKGRSVSTEGLFFCLGMLGGTTCMARDYASSGVPQQVILKEHLTARHRCDAKNQYLIEPTDPGL
jgi:hypothetical protein